MALTVPNTFVAGTTAVASEVNDNFVAVKTFVDGLETDITALEVKSPVITLAGDLTGSATLTNLGNATLTATVAANSVALGTDTTGNYVSNVAGGTGITVTHTPGEGSTPTVAVTANTYDAFGAASTAATNAATALSNHESDTTNIHGIADTSILVTTSGSQTLTNKTITTPLGIVKGDVGLGNVDNTSDANKPVSTATQTALNLKSNLASPTFTGTVVLPSTTSIGTVSSTEIGYVDGVTSAIQTQLDAKSPSASPTFTGTVVLPSTTSIGTVSSTEIGYVDGVTSAIQTQLNGKAPLASPALTGVPTAPTATIGTNTTQVATTEFVLANTGSVPSNTITSAMIVDGTIVNADINASAAIALSKLANGSSAQIVVADSGGVPTYRTVSGDVTVSNTGVTAIGSGVIVNADINASAAIAASKISGTAIVQTIVDAKGDLIVASANDAVGRLAVGATNGHVLTVDSTESLGVKWAAVAGGSGMTELDAQTFTSSGTYTVPTGAKLFVVDFYGAGGGGGSGRWAAAGMTATGGGGGAGGSYSNFTCSAALFGSSITYTIGAGGTGALAPTTQGTSGKNGSIGGQSRFGSLYFGGGLGGRGGGSTTTPGAQGYTSTLINAGFGNSSSIGFGAGANGASATGGSGVFGLVGGGGGGGGGGSSGNGGGAGGGTTTLPHSAIDTTNVVYSPVSAGGGTGGSTNGGSGGNGSAKEGGGGGGGQGFGGVGGNGGAPSGGGGGGGGVNLLSTSSAGGNGGRAEIKIWVFG